MHAQTHTCMCTYMCTYMYVYVYMHVLAHHPSSKGWAPRCPIHIEFGSEFFATNLASVLYTYVHNAMFIVHSSQVWASVLKSYQLERLKVVVKRRPFINTTAARCQARESKVYVYMYICHIMNIHETLDSNLCGKVSSS